MGDETESVGTACAVCERRLLPGERPSPFVTAAGAEVLVCDLCKVRAEAAGWLRPEEAAAGSTSGPRDHRQRGQIFGALMGRRERSSSHRSRDRGRSEAAKARPEQESAGSEEVHGEEARPAPRDQHSPAGFAAGPDLAEAISAFNDSEHRRTVARLSRSLGTPQASAIAVRTHSGATGARLTIAWDLAWYQWEVGPGTRRPEIRQIGKGGTLDQLRAADRNWNVDVGDDGALQRRAAGG